MKFFVWLFFLLIGGVNVWAAGPKILFIGDSITDGNFNNGRKIKFNNFIVTVCTDLFIDFLYGSCVNLISY